MSLIRMTATLTALALCTFISACSRTEQQGTAGPTEKVTFAYANITDCALVQIAQKKGYFLQQGLAVTPRAYTFGKPALQDVLDGKADFAAVAETPCMFAIMNGQKIALITTIQSSKTEHVIVARKDRGILTAADLKGKKIAATAGTTSELFMDVFLASNDISRNEIAFANLKVEELPEALTNGVVDAISVFNPYTITAQKKLGSKSITFLDDEIFTSTFNIAAQQDFIRNNPEKVKKVLRALVKAEEFLNDNPGEAQKIVADSIGVDLEVVSHIWKDSSFRLVLDQQLVLALEDESRWAIKRGLTGNKIIPNYLDFIHLDAMQSIKPEAVRILK